jgi:hypothetical protein
MFRKLCGAKSLNSVVLATTMWAQDTPRAYSDCPRYESPIFYLILIHTTKVAPHYSDRNNWLDNSFPLYGHTTKLTFVAPGNLGSKPGLSLLLPSTQNLPEIGSIPGTVSMTLWVKSKMQEKDDDSFWPTNKLWSSSRIRISGSSSMRCLWSPKLVLSSMRIRQV